METIKETKLQIENKELNMILAIAKALEIEPQELFTHILEKELAEYCDPDGEFNPKKAILFTVDKNNKWHNNGEGYVLSEIDIYGKYDYYRVLRNSKLEIYPKEQVVFH